MQTTMNWYYMKKGCFRKRGVASWNDLEAMARIGELQETDLLYREGARGRWVRASSMPKLFIHKTPSEPAVEPVPLASPVPPQPHRAPTVGPAPVPLAPPAPPQPHRAPTVKKQPEKQTSIGSKVYLAILCLALLAILASVISGVMRNEPQPPPPPPSHPQPPPPPVIPEETNRWQSVEADVTGLIQSGRLKEADEAINRYIDDGGPNEISAGLSHKLDHARKHEQLKESYAIFRENRAGNDHLIVLAALSDELGETETLVSTLKSELTAEPPPTPATSHSILALARILQHHDLQVTAVDALGRDFNSASSSDCLDIVQLYTEYQLVDKAITLLQNFTEANPDASEAWLELAALLSLQKDTDASLASLKKAIQTGGEPVREKAREDPRFDAVRGTWTFRWQTR